MTENTNQDGQGPAPVVAPATTVTPTVVSPTTNPASPEAAAALAQGKVTPEVQSTSPVVESSPKPVVIGEPETPEGPTVQSEEGNVVVYDATGDAGMDMALSFVGKLGLKPDHPAMQKAAEGDFSFIKAHMATLGDKARGWEQHIALAEQAYANNVKTAEANTKAITTAVYAQAGGQEQWAAIEKWAKANADQKEREVINRMLAADPVQAQAAVLLLKQNYERATGTIITPAKPLKDNTPSADGNAAVTKGPLSAKDYAQACAQLNRADPDAMRLNKPAYQELNQRRLAYQG